ncbi:phosphate/phosphite/phosphonate ABC transporter substrate-binding protein [Massilia niabensis]|uniref:Phosphate/phosphite/phosphonate ABC transporter substrate-binding protein n=1 Tax=Massilia niabensis TaxID=544910 RepID=A0ABW0L5A1_9BURK
MRMTIRAGFVLFLTLFSALLLAAPASAASPVYQFSPVNQYNLQLSAGFWNPIVRYVSEKSGVRLELKLGRTSADTTSFVLTREVDFAFTNHLFSPERERLGWTVFARPDRPPVHAQIVVPVDSPVRSLADLAGSTVVFSGPEALLAYKIPHAELLRRRLKVNVVFTGNMDAAFAQLFSGRARAAGAHSELAQRYGARENKAFRVLWTSAPFNDLALMASPRVPRAHVQAVADAFVSMGREPEGRRILAAALALVHGGEALSESLSFVGATGADYDAYRRFHHAAPANPR